MIALNNDATLANLSVPEIKKQMMNIREQYKIAKENFEFEYGLMLKEEMKELKQELTKRLAV